MNEVETKRKKYNTLFAVAIIGAGLIVSPIIFLAVKGIIGLLIAGTIGLLALAFGPVFSMKLANWKVKSIVDEAKKNPIETLTNLIIDEKERFALQRKAVIDSITASESFAAKYKQYVVKYPDRASEFETKLEGNKKRVDRQVAALKARSDAIAHSEVKLVEMKDYWEMSQAEIAAAKASGSSLDDVYAKLSHDTAVQAVFDSMSRASAEMEIALAIENKPSQTFSGLTIDVESNVTK